MAKSIKDLADLLLKGIVEFVTNYPGNEYADLKEVSEVYKINESIDRLTDALIYLKKKELIIAPDVESEKIKLAKPTDKGKLHYEKIVDVANIKTDMPEKVRIDGTNIILTFKGPYVVNEIGGWIIDNNKHEVGQVVHLTKNEYEEYRKHVSIIPQGELMKGITKELHRLDTLDDKIDYLNKVKAKYEFDKGYPTGNNNFIDWVNEKLEKYYKLKGKRTIANKSELSVIDRDDFLRVIDRYVSSFEMVKKSVKNLEINDQILIYERLLLDLKEENEYPYLKYVEGIEDKINAEINYLEKTKTFENERKMSDFKISGDWELYNNHNFDIVKIAEHFEKIKDPQLGVLYLNWLSLEADDRFKERMTKQTKEEKKTKGYKEGLFTHESIKRFVKDKLKICTNDKGKNEKGEKQNKTKLEYPMKNRKIKWDGSETQIVYLIEELIKNRFLPKETDREKYKIISEHFVNKDNKDFKTKQLGVTFQNLTGKRPTRSEKIDEIITKLKDK